MAFLKKPLKWTALGQEPSELKKSEGFKMDESPAPGHFDFMFRSTYEAIEELQQKAGEVKTVNNIQPDSNGNVLITLPDTSKLYQKPTSGIPKTDLDATVQASLKKADDSAPLTELAKTNQALTTHQADLAYQTAGGTANAITLTTATLTNGYAKTFIASANNSGSATTINSKPLYKPNTTTAPTLIAGKAYTIWYNESSDCFFIKASAEGNATTAQVLAGATFSNENDNGLVGTIPSKGTQTYTPGTANQTIAANQFLSGIQTILGDPDLIASNIKKGVNIFGVLGTVDIASMGGLQQASGTVTSSSDITTYSYADSTNNNTPKYSAAVSGLSFTPKYVILDAKPSGGIGQLTLYSAKSDGYYNSNTVRLLEHSNNAASSYILSLKGSSLVYSGGFSLPVNYSAMSVSWLAIG